MASTNVLTRTRKQKAVVLFRSQRFEEARPLLEQVCKLDRADFDSWCMLAEINQRLGRLDDTVTCLVRIVSLRPEIPEVHFNLGNALKSLDKLTEAIESYRRALACRPDFVEAWCNLGSVFEYQRSYEEAVACYSKALALRPGLAELHFNLGNTLRALGRLEEAEASYRAALQANAGFIETYINLGSTLESLAQPEQAVQIYRQAIALDPRSHAAHNNLGTLYRAQGKLTAAIECYLKSLGVRQDAETLGNLGNAYLMQGNVQEALASYRKAAEKDPRYEATHGDYLFAMNYQPGIDPEELSEAHRKWGARCTRGAMRFQHQETRDPDRRLRIGYVSPDFWSHSISYFIEPILANHDRDGFEVFCYAEPKREDATTERLKALATHWRDVRNLDHLQLAGQIHRDGIDILVDLAGHTGGNRLPVFALKPAPLQLTYLGYPNTTGLAEMDYRITDGTADPDGQEKFHTERLLRLPRGFLCYAPPKQTPPIGEVPMLRTGYVTFGSFNALPKMNDEVVALWAKILSVVPGSRLVLKNKSLTDESTAERYVAQFAKCGISRDRLDLIGWVASSVDHLALYGRIDVALDTFPYNGTTTTCEALWMGVPVVTLEGNRHASRVSASLLHGIGVPHLIADTPDGYVALAARLATDTGVLRALRCELRKRIAASPWGDGSTFTRDLEHAYREVWRSWCSSGFSRKPRLTPREAGEG